eukprot:UC4_evm2s1221
MFSRRNSKANSDCLEDTGTASQEMIIKRREELARNQELGAIRRHTQCIKELRRSRIASLEVKSNQLLNRINKLLSNNSGQIWSKLNPKARSKFEQSIVKWDDDSACSTCGKVFGMLSFGGKNHCRLCGSVICSDNCTLALAISEARKLANLSDLPDDKDDFIAVCSVCESVLHGKRQKILRQSTKPSEVDKIYPDIIRLMGEIEENLPIFNGMAFRLQEPDNDFACYDDAVRLRDKVMGLFALLDKISKKILALGDIDKGEKRFNSAKVSSNIRRRVSDFLQMYMFTLQKIPSVTEANKRKSEINRQNHMKISRRSSMASPINLTPSSVRQDPPQPRQAAVKDNTIENITTSSSLTSKDDRSPESEGEPKKRRMPTSINTSLPPVNLKDENSKTILEKQRVLIKHFAGKAKSMGKANESFHSCHNMRAFAKSGNAKNAKNFALFDMNHLKCISVA